jgi:hypothetical protein
MLNKDERIGKNYEELSSRDGFTLPWDTRPEKVVGALSIAAERRPTGVADRCRSRRHVNLEYTYFLGLSF